MFDPAPESHKGLLAQQEQLVRGDRHVQMFPKGHEELPLKPGFNRVETAKGDIFHHRPEKVSEMEIHHASAIGAENHLLGLGPVSKHEVLLRMLRGEQPLAVVERDPEGTEVRGAAGTDKTASAQLLHLLMHKSDGHTVGIEKPMDLLKSRDE
jgi:hypothetical protein